MNEQAVLLVEVLEQRENMLKVRSFLDDNTPFEVVVNEQEVKRIPKTEDPKVHPDRGWMNVSFSGENNGRANITLSQPDLNLGRQVTVSTSRLKRANDSSATVAASAYTNSLPITVDSTASNSKIAADKQAVRESLDNN